MNRSPFFGKKRAPAGGNRGMTTSGCLSFLLLLAILGFVGYKIGIAYWEYYQVREQVREVLTWTVAGQPKHQADVVKKVIAKIRDESGLYLTPKNVRLTQTANSLTLSVFWVHDLDFLVYTYPWDLEVSLTEAIRWGGRGLVIK
ncbi:MAG: hypothetical protein AMJ94_18575 [Deltaproteobacteria bacterium SM23_61]|nr:MAG: hypothetical protein AMJ94_18575 [Deltaproteobacteria bacterium SM23_61]